MKINSIPSQQNAKIRRRRKIKGASENFIFISNISTAQGDSRSPVLVIVYSEHGLRDIRSTLSTPWSRSVEPLHQEIIHAWDIDLIDIDHFDTKQIQKIPGKVPTENKYRQDRIYNAIWKWEYMEEHQKVESLIGPNEDIERRRKHFSYSSDGKTEQWLFSQG